MRHTLAAALCLATATPLWAQIPDVDPMVDDHVIPRYEALVAATSAFSEVAQADCAPESEALRAAYGEAFDAWVRVSHIRFGPSEDETRGFALAFWPDPRGSAQRTLASLIADEDPIVNDLDEWQTISVAVRGFYAVEFLLYDAQFIDSDNPEYRCTLIQTIAADIADTSADILADWEGGYGDLIRNAGGNDTYRTETEAAQQLFTALSTGLEFTSETRIARPMGSFDRPRPNRAEARRSGRSLRHVILSLDGTRDLAAMLSSNDPAVDEAYADALARAEGFGDPTFAGVAETQGRFRLELLKGDVDTIRRILSRQIGPRIGIAAGFNSLDGD